MAIASLLRPMPLQSQTRLGEGGIAPQVEVKTYPSAKDYNRDAPRMAAPGWPPQGQSQAELTSVWGAHLESQRSDR